MREQEVKREKKMVKEEQCKKMICERVVVRKKEGRVKKRADKALFFFFELHRFE